MKVENGKLKIMVGKTVCKTQTIVARPFCLYESHCHTVAANSVRQSDRLQKSVRHCTIFVNYKISFTK